MNTRLSAFFFAVLCAIGANADVDRESAYNTKHTASECATYLCNGNAEVALKAESYISGGCVGSFSSYVNDLLSKQQQSQLSETKDTTQGVSSSALVGIAGSLGLVGAVVGFIAGRRERPQSVGYSKLPSNE